MRVHTKIWFSVWASHTRMTLESPLTRSVPPCCFQSVTRPLPAPRFIVITSFSALNELTICTGPFPRSGS